jgi:tRNA threonylcarbamoyladenosine biosynthesis protein TsaB
MTCAGDAPRLLAIDSAGDRLAVALVAGDTTFGADEEGGARASLRALPLAMELLERAGLVPADLDAVAFGRGPGAFTGLRTACSIAQGLALGVGCPVLPLDSLALVAEDARARLPADATSVWVAVDARMDEVYAAEYALDEHWRALREPALWTVPALAAAWQAKPPRVVAGNALAAFGARLLPDGVALRLPSLHDRAGALARLARSAWAGGDGGVDVAQALPLYLRDKVALTTAERAGAAVA